MIKQIVKILCLFILFLPCLCWAEIRISVIAPKSGEYKTWGDELIAGAQIAIDEINAEGGIKGKKLELMGVDDPCSENLSISMAQMQAISSENKPSLVIGPYCSNGFDTVAQIYSKAKIFQIIPTTLNYSHAAQNHKGMIKMVGFKEQASKDFFQFYNKHYAGQRVALIYDNEIDTVVESSQALVDEFRRYGKASLLKTYSFEDLDGDLSEIADAVDASGEDIVVIWGKSKKIAKTIRNIKRLNKNVIIFTNKYMVGDDFAEYAQEYLNNVYFMAQPSFEDNADFAETIVHLRLKGVDCDGLNIYGYAAVKMWVELVKAAGGFSYDRLVAKVQGGKFQTSWGDAFFNNGSIKEPIHYLFYQMKNGDYIQVE